MTEKSSPRSVDLEEVLEREAGRFGRHQLRVMALCAVATICAALTTNEFVFTTSRINTRCLIPECESSDGQQEFAPSWILNAVPSEGDRFANCERFANSSAVAPAGTCPAALFDRNTVIDCDQHIYENTDSVVYSLGLACDEWQRSLIGSIRTTGALISLPLAGMVSDRWGRRTALAIVLFNAAWIGVLRFWATTYIGFVIAVFAESALGSGAITGCSYILVAESMPKKYRVATCSLIISFFATGQVCLGLLAWALPYWRHLTLAICAPQLLFLTYFWIVPESVRWYLSKGRYEEAEAALIQIAKTNGQQVSEKTLIELRYAADEQKRRTAEENSSNEPWLIVLVFQHKKILLRCFLTPVWWIAMTLIYYGLSINAVNITGNRYLNYVAVSAVEIPGAWTAMLLFDRIGRKPVNIGAYWICAASQIAFIFMPPDMYWAGLVVYLVGKYSIAIVATAVYLYTSELFPTRHRHRLFGYSSMMGRIGSIVAPLTPALGTTVWEHLPFVLFGGMAFLSGLLMFLTPETRGCPLPDTMEEAAHIGRKPVHRASDAEVISRL